MVKLASPTASDTQARTRAARGPRAVTLEDGAMVPAPGAMTPYLSLPDVLAAFGRWLAVLGKHASSRATHSVARHHHPAPPQPARAA